MRVHISAEKAILMASLVLLTTTQEGRAGDALCFQPIAWKWASSHPQACSAFGCAAAGEDIVTIGGTYWAEEGGRSEKRYVAQVWRLRGNQAWSAWPSFPRAIGQVMAVAVGSKIFAIGGRDGDLAFAETRWLDTANTASGWQSGSTLPAPLFSLIGGVWENTVYVVTDPYATIEGQPSVVPPSSIWACDLSSDKAAWMQIAQAPDPEVGFRTAAIIDGKLVLFGGATEANSGSLELQDAVWILDLESRQWSRGRSLPVPLRDASAIDVDQRYILVAGGVEEAGSSQKTAGDGRIYLTHRCLAYDIVGDEFTPIESLRLAVADHGLARCGSEVFIIAGEDSPYRTRTDLVETGTWVGHERQ